MVHFQNTATFAEICVFVGCEKSDREKACMSEGIISHIQHGYIWVTWYLKLLNFLSFELCPHVLLIRKFLSEMGRIEPI